MSDVELLGALFEIAQEVVAIFLFAAAPVLVFGVPILLATVRMPARLGVQPLKEEDLSDRQREALGAIDDLMRPQGLFSAMTFSAVELAGQNIARVYLSSADPVVAIAACASHTSEAGTIASQFFELQTEFADGTVVHTRNTAHAPILEHLPNEEMHEHPEIQNPLTLKLRHDEYCEPHRARGARFYAADDLIEYLEEDNAKQMAYGIKRGRLARLENGGCRLSVGSAIRQVTAFVNPAQHPRPAINLATLLLLCTLPIATVAIVDLPSFGLTQFVSAALPTISPETAIFLALLPMVGIGSVAMGAMLGPKAAIWCAFLVIVESSLLLSEGVPGLGGFLPVGGLILVSTKIASLTTNAINRQRDWT